MRCLFCGKELPFLKRLTKGEFCSAAHRRQYQAEYSQLALTRLLQAKPPEEQFHTEDPPRPIPASIMKRYGAKPPEGASAPDGKSAASFDTISPPGGGTADRGPAVRVPTHQSFAEATNRPPTRASSPSPRAFSPSPRASTPLPAAAPSLASAPSLGALPTASVSPSPATPRSLVGLSPRESGTKTSEGTIAVAEAPAAGASPHPSITARIADPVAIPGPAPAAAALQLQTAEPVAERATTPAAIPASPVRAEAAAPAKIAGKIVLRPVAAAAKAIVPKTGELEWLSAARPEIPHNGLAAPVVQLETARRLPIQTIPGASPTPEGGVVVRLDIRDFGRIDPVLDLGARIEQPRIESSSEPAAVDFAPAVSREGSGVWTERPRDFHPGPLRIGEFAALDLRTTGFEISSPFEEQPNAREAISIEELPQAPTVSKELAQERGGLRSTPEIEAVLEVKPAPEAKTEQVTKKASLATQEPPLAQEPAPLRAPAPEVKTGAPAGSSETEKPPAPEVIAATVAKLAARVAELEKEKPDKKPATENAAKETPAPAVEKASPPPLPVEHALAPAPSPGPSLIRKLADALKARAPKPVADAPAPARIPLASASETPAGRKPQAAAEPVAKAAPPDVIGSKVIEPKRVEPKQIEPQAAAGAKTPVDAPARPTVEKPAVAQIATQSAKVDAAPQAAATPVGAPSAGAPSVGAPGAAAPSEPAKSEPAISEQIAAPARVDEEKSRAPELATKPMPVALESVPAGKAKPVQIFAATLKSPGPAQIPPHDAAPLRATMIVDRSETIPKIDSGTKPEAAKPEVAKQEAAKQEAAKLEPARIDPAKLEVSKSDPAKPAPAKPETGKSEAAKPAPPKPEPAAAESAKPGTETKSAPKIESSPRLEKPNSELVRSESAPRIDAQPKPQRAAEPVKAAAPVPEAQTPAPSEAPPGASSASQPKIAPAPPRPRAASPAPLRPAELPPVPPLKSAPPPMPLLIEQIGAIDSNLELARELADVSRRQTEVNREHAEFNREQAKFNREQAKMTPVAGAASPLMAPPPPAVPPAPEIKPATLPHTPVPKPGTLGLPGPPPEGDLGLPQLDLASVKNPLPLPVKIATAAACVILLTGGVWFYTNSNRPKGPEPVVSLSAGVGPEWLENFSPDLKHPRTISVLRASEQLSDYTIEFNASVDAKAIGWVFRAKDPANYYVGRIEQETTPTGMKAAFVYFPVIDGVAQAHKRSSVGLPAAPGMVYRIRFEVNGGQFSAWIQDRKVDEWTDARLMTGGAGLYSEEGERALLQGPFRVVPWGAVR